MIVMVVGLSLVWITGFVVVCMVLVRSPTIESHGFGNLLNRRPFTTRRTVHAHLNSTTNSRGGGGGASGASSREERIPFTDEPNPTYHASVGVRGPQGRKQTPKVMNTNTSYP
jgi:hypothetical protein